MYNNLPFVTFQYPSAANNDYLKYRFVRVVSMDDTYVRGHEFETSCPSATDKGTFKSYLKAKISFCGVALLKFEQPPQT